MPGLVRRTARDWPSVMVPLVAQAPPLMLICGLPSPYTVTGTPVVIPVMVTVSEVIKVLNGTPV